MIYFLFGPDTYSSRKKLGGIITAFQKKAGDGVTSGLVRVDVGDDPDAVFSVGRTASLFSKKELVVLERVSVLGAPGTAHIEGQLARWADDSALTVVFWEGEVAIKKHPLLIKIQKAALQSQDFSPLSPALLGRWLDREAAERGLTLNAEEKRILFQAFGSDLWALSGEIEKMRNGWSPREVSKIATQVWDFTDVFLEHRRRSFLPLARLIEDGLEPVQILAALGGALRTMALIGKGIESGKLKTLTARLHPFVVKKNMERARRMAPGTLKERFADVVDADVALKTGQLPPPLPLVKLALKE